MLFKDIVMLSILSLVVIILLSFIYLNRDKAEILSGLFLDDERYPDDITWLDYSMITDTNGDYVDIKWTIVRTPEEFNKALERNSKPSLFRKQFKLYSFDHDLGTETTGYDLLKVLIEDLFNNQQLPIPVILFHTQNNIGLKNMSQYWNNALENIKENRYGL